MPEISDLNTAESFAGILGVTAPTASRIIKSGEIESLSDGRRRLVPREAVIQYLEKHNLVPEPPDHARRAEVSTKRLRVPYPQPVGRATIIILVR